MVKNLTLIKKYHLSLVAIFRNEHRYIEEWLKYHLKVGVDHFYLYDNGGDHKASLDPFMSHITYTLWTDDIAKNRIGTSDYSRQTMAYTDCVIVYGQETEWLQLIDLDEYLVPLDANEVGRSMKIYENEGIDKLRIRRFNFGNDGHWRKPTTASIDSYLRRERRSSHHKDMGRADAIKKVNGPHSFKIEGQTVIPENLSLHHHYTRSLDDWMERAKIGGGQAGKGFRVFIGERKWLAYLTFFALNAKSLYVLFFLIGFDLALWLSPSSPIMLLINLPLLGALLFSFLRGQNEVKDMRMRELMDRN